MGNFIANRSISCIYCGCPNVRGKETTKTTNTGKLIHECKWVCHKCGNVVRKDSNQVK